MSWSRNPQPRSMSARLGGQEPGECYPDTELSKLREQVEALELRCTAERRSNDTLARKLREMTSAYHELLDREEKAIEGIALAMLELPKDMGLLEYVSAINEYATKLRNAQS